jgi:hypothetical protein
MGLRFLDQKQLGPLIFLGKQKKFTGHEQEIVGAEARFAGSIKNEVQFLKQLPQAGFLRSLGPTYADDAPNAIPAEREFLEMCINVSPNTANPWVPLKESVGKIADAEDAKITERLRFDGGACIEILAAPYGLCLLENLG